MRFVFLWNKIELIASIEFGNRTHRKVPVQLIRFDYRTNRPTIRPIGFDWFLVRFRSIDYAGNISTTTYCLSLLFCRSSLDSVQHCVRIKFWRRPLWSVHFAHLHSFPIPFLISGYLLQTPANSNPFPFSLELSGADCMSALPGAHNMDSWRYTVCNVNM